MVANEGQRLCREHERVWVDSLEAGTVPGYDLVGSKVELKIETVLSEEERVLGVEETGMAMMMGREELK
jgi:hypothetical protein